MPKQEQQYQEMHAKVMGMRDRLGTPIDVGMIDTVLYLNLLAIPTVQSCEGHLDHGCPYPWVIVENAPVSQRFRTQWAEVCRLEEQAKDDQTQDAYDRYLAANMALNLSVAQWEQEDALYNRLTSLLQQHYLGQEATPEHLTITRMHPGLFRLEPAFFAQVKQVPEHLKPTYLTRGRGAMGLFTLFLKSHWI
jgi:hypothetical protein